MENPETSKDHNKDIFYLRRELEALSTTVKEGFKELNDNIEFMNENYVRKEDSKEEIKRLEGLIAEKASSESFKKLESTLNKLVWAIVTPLITGAVAGLVYLATTVAK